MKILKITTKKHLWTSSPIHGTEKDTDERMVKVYPDIIKRDKHTCQYCGFKSKKYMEIHHIDHNHNNFDEKNLTTCCPLCHQCFHLPTVEAYKGGKMIWLPEIPQNILNNLCIHIFIAMKTKDNSSAQTMYTDLSERGAFLVNMIGKKQDSDKASAFAELMVGLDLDKLEDQIIYNNIQNNIRILPDISRFNTQVEYWANEYKANDPENSSYTAFKNTRFAKIYKTYEENTNVSSSEQDKNEELNF